MKKITYKKLDLYLLLVSIFLIIVLNPYYVWGFFQGAYTTALLVVLSFSFFFPTIFSEKKIFLSIFVFAGVFIYFLMNNASILGGLAFAMGVAFIFSIKNKYLLELFQKFKFVYSFVLFPGLVLWGMHLILGNDFLYLGEIPAELNPSKLKEEIGEGYALYPFTVVLDYMLNLPVYRFMGPFDEPGRVGTVSAIILAVNQFKFKNKSDYVILLSGIVSFSLAFYILVFIYLAIVSISRAKYFAALVVFIVLVISIASVNSTISKFTVDRISTSDGEISGDNRATTNLDYDFKAWINGSTTQFLIGTYGYVPDGSSSWKLVAVKTGVVGVSIILLVLFIGYFSVGIRRYSYLSLAAFLMVCLASFYQRPEVLEPMFIMLFLLGLISSKKIGLIGG